MPTASTSTPRPDPPDVIVPIGTPGGEALRRLEAAGYACTLMEDEKFRYQPPDQPHRAEGYYAEHIDFIQCSQKHNNGIVTWIDTWALVLDDESHVTRILHRGEGVGP
jgi:hypothetical protein